MNASAELALRSASLHILKSPRSKRKEPLRSIRGTVRKDERPECISVPSAAQRSIGTPTFYRLISASRSAPSWILPSLPQLAPFGSSPGIHGLISITISNTSNKRLSRENRTRVRDEISTDWWLPMREDSL